MSVRTEGAWDRLFEVTTWRRMACCMALTSAMAAGACFALPLLFGPDNVAAGFIGGSIFGFTAVFSGFWLAGATTPASARPRWRQ